MMVVPHKGSRLGLYAEDLWLPHLADQKHTLPPRSSRGLDVDATILQRTWMMAHGFASLLLEY